MGIFSGKTDAEKLEDAAKKIEVAENAQLEAESKAETAEGKVEAAEKRADDAESKVEAATKRGDDAVNEAKKELGIDSKEMIKKAAEQKLKIRRNDRVSLIVLNDTRHYRKDQLIQPHAVVAKELMKKKLAEIYVAPKEESVEEED